IAAGSRGDLQPCLALGRGLASRGHRVRVIASTRYTSLIEATGLEAAPLTADPTEILDSEAGQELLAGGRNPIRFIRGFRRILGPMAERLLTELLDASKGADLILGPNLAMLPRHLAEHLAVPWALIHFQPSHPTNAFPHPFLPWTNRLGGWANRAGFLAVDQIAWQFCRPFINPWRRESLNLPPTSIRGPMKDARRQEIPVLACFSEQVVPRPRDWPRHVHTTGYWFLDDPTWEPSPPLRDFLDAGSPPVYVGFGSMRPQDPEATDRTIRTALREAKVRGIVQGDPATSSDDILAVQDVPHSWLFPRMAAVVHHGGAGTTAAGLRAGVPTIVCPFFGDQPYWAERVAALKAGPSPIPFHELTAPRLTAAVHEALNNPEITEHSAALGHRISSEDGITHACEALETLLSKR
ncbi:glycosyltransferase, partial [Actinomadura adrarensis]